MKNWFKNLLTPDHDPSSATLISLAAGITGIVIAIISTFMQTVNGLELSKFLVLVGAGMKLGHEMTKKIGPK